MTSRDFCYWLQGCLELRGLEPFNDKQMEILKTHLSMVFKHEIDPSFGDKENQNALTNLHTGPFSPPSDTLIKC